MPQHPPEILGFDKLTRELLIWTNSPQTTQLVTNTLPVVN
jgi:hypothetical protein